MKEAIFSKDRINTGRQTEIDALKAFSIIMMIITHCIDDLYGNYSENVIAVVINDYLAQSVGASGFMICMGVGIVYSRNAEPIDYLKRGVNLLVVGQLLNLFRYGLPFILGYVISGDPVLKISSYLVFSGDILQFAGLFFFMMALFRKLKLKSWHIFIIAVILNIIANSFFFGFHPTQSYAFDQLMGLFFLTPAESYFPLFHWLIYPAYGMVFGDILQHVKDKTKFYGILIGPSAAIFAIYYYIGICVDQHFFTVFRKWQTFCGVGIWDALMHLFCNTFMISCGYFLTFKLSKQQLRPIFFVSKNINRFYCIHTVLVYFIEVFLIDIAGLEINAIQCFGIALLMVISCILGVMVYSRYLVGPCHTFFDKHKYIWGAVIVILSAAICIWSSYGTTGHVNLWNEYSLDQKMELGDL